MINYSITFYIRSYRTDKQGRCPIYMRITIDGQRAEMSTGEKINPAKWESKTSRVIGNNNQAYETNKHLQQLEHRVREIRNELARTNQPITSDIIKSELKTGKQEEEHMLLKRFKKNNLKIEKLIGRDYSRATFNKYEVSYTYFKTFVNEYYGKSDIPLNKLNQEAVEAYEVFLKGEKDLAHNTAIKHMSRLKTIVLDALQKGLITSNPMRNINFTYEPTKPTYLSYAELKGIEDKEFRYDSLERVRDVFVFCCYTGLAFSDADSLRYHHFQTDNDGDMWLIKERVKTDEPARILMLPKAKQILEKYRDYESSWIKKEQVLPTLSNARMNLYLKDIAKLCGIEKRLTTHVARHTFATTVTLENGIPLESVQLMLGHKRRESTEIYAKVTNYKLGKEMKKLRRQLD